MPRSDLLSYFQPLPSAARAPSMSMAASPQSIRTSLRLERTVIELNQEEELFLERLVDVYQNGGTVEEFIEHRLNGELRHPVENPTEGGYVVLVSPCYDYDPQYDVERSICDSLVDKGMLVRREDGWYGNLTHGGRNYFKEKERRAREVEEERAYSRRQAAKALAASAALSVFLNLDKVARMLSQLAAWLSSVAPGT